ncbi:hypothetical protein MNBD_GAMMA16-1050 [hydrothermal vent metagenome]|uniref:Uncharacterized protein n=1 Tax=hydrothermal vent metagenome TaxID=652676 RepID=A0A3B0Z5X0_9ZZZZ
MIFTKKPPTRRDKTSLGGEFTLIEIPNPRLALREIMVLNPGFSQIAKAKGI